MYVGRGGMFPSLLVLGLRDNVNVVTASIDCAQRGGESIQTGARYFVSIHPVFPFAVSMNDHRTMSEFSTVVMYPREVVRVLPALSALKATVTMSLTSTVALF